MEQIFEHPTSHNIEWHAVTSLLEAIGTVTVRHDHKLAVKVGDEQEFLDPPAGKDILTASANNLYVGVTMADLEDIREEYPLNSRLVKTGGGT